MPHITHRQDILFSNKLEHVQPLMTRHRTRLKVTLGNQTSLENAGKSQRSFPKKTMKPSDFPMFSHAFPMFPTPT